MVHLELSGDFRILPARLARIVKWTGPVLMIGLCGCGGARDGLPRQEISGTVTLNAAPAPPGHDSVLACRPPSAGATNTPAPAGAQSRPRILPGPPRSPLRSPRASSRSSEQKGLVPGSYKVQVYGADLSAVPADAARPGTSSTEGNHPETLQHGHDVDRCCQGRWS